MATYRVKPGYRHGKDGQYGPGDNIELSVEEAAGFLDKLELVEASAGSATGNEQGQQPLPDDKLNSIEPWRGLDAKVVLLLEAATITPAMMTSMSDDELLAVAGIGPASLTKIRAAFNG